MAAARFAVWLLFVASTSLAWADGEVVRQSAREIPLAGQYDVVVVGGSTGAVAAAVAAAEGGAEVFLATPRPYLGDNMTATLHLWREKYDAIDSPLAEALFDDQVVSPAQPDPNRIALTYTTDLAPDPLHGDTSPPKRLTDGRWGNPVDQSVQYNGSVTIVADLQKSQPVASVRLVAYHNDAGDAAEPSAASGTRFLVERVVVSISDDGQQWTESAVVANDDPAQGLAYLTAPLGAEARYVRLRVEKPDRAGRLLLGELEIVGPASEEPSKKRVTLPPPRPMHVKRVLDDALLAAGVDFLYGCFATDVLRDQAGNVCGIVMANRAGRQAVVGKVVIDASDAAVAARAAGAELQPFRPINGRILQRIVIGGEPVKADDLSHRMIEPGYPGSLPNAPGPFAVIHYRLPFPVPDDSFATYCRLDQQARTITYHPDQQFTSDGLWWFLFRRIVGDRPDPVRLSARTADALPLWPFQPSGIDRLWVLSPCADVPPCSAYRKFFDMPGHSIALGTRIGRLAGEQAAALAAPEGVHVPGGAVESSAAAGEVREMLAGARPVGKPETIPQREGPLPVLGRYDVVVIGGGTCGAPAGIAAARQGAKTLVVEYQYGLGGVGTMGAIASYYWGNRVGFTATVRDGETRWMPQQKAEWWRRELLDAGGELWFGAIGCGAVVEQGRVVGAVVATPTGRGVVLADVVVDATGNADVAAAAGAACEYTDASEFGMQGTGLPGLRLGGSYNNTDFTIVDETDMHDVWHMLVYAKHKYADAFDQGKLIDTRERRRIVGDTTITLLDQVLLRTHPDTVYQAHSNFDTHGYTIDPYLELTHPDKRGFTVNVPYRCLLPKGLEGILVGGLGASAHRDAVPLIRMQADIQNQGYAIGVASAMAATADVTPRQIDISRLQEHLIEIGNLKSDVLDADDSFPLDGERIARAVAQLADDPGAPAVILTHRAQALPLLQDAFVKADAERKLIYAQTLAVLGDARGIDVIAARLTESSVWDEGWNYRGMGQFGSALSAQDRLIVALGRAGDRRALPTILAKLEQLDARSDFSHHRAVALALELLADPAAAAPLAALLEKEGMTGYVHDNVAKAREQGTPGGTNAVATRRHSLRELMLARALLRCGDHEGRGAAILRAYTHDLRGHLARHAQAVLDASR